MDSTSRNAQGYSDFFTSGLRAMTGRDRRRTKAKSADLSQSAHNRSSFWTDEYFELGQSSSNNNNNNPFSGRRRASVIIGRTVEDDGTHISPNTKKRRSGLSSFSARWFSRAKEPVSSSPSIPPATHDEDDHALYADDEKEQSSLSIESPSLPSLHERSPPLHPFSSWSDGGTTAPDLSTFKLARKRESFLSLNSSSSSLSSIIFPAVPWSIPSFAEYRNPLIPSPFTQSSSSSSWDHRGGDKGEWGGVEEEEEEEETPIETSYTSEDQETCDWDAPASIDWRQFHVHLLQIANDSTKL